METSVSKTMGKGWIPPNNTKIMGLTQLREELRGKGQSEIEQRRGMYAILADVLNGPCEPDHYDFFDTGFEVALDLMVHFGLPIDWREHFYH